MTAPSVASLPIVNLLFRLAGPRTFPRRGGDYLFAPVKDPAHAYVIGRRVESNVVSGERRGNENPEEQDHQQDPGQDYGSARQLTHKIAIIARRTAQRNGWRFQP